MAKHRRIAPLLTWTLTILFIAQAVSAYHEQKDYCNDPYETVCQGAGGKEACQNQPEDYSYTCTGCPEDSVWNMNTRRCLRVKCPESDHELVGGIENLECKCSAGQFWNGHNCETFDVCNNAHREFLKGKDFDCPADSHCEAIGENRTIIDLNAYQCKCKFGYLNRKGDRRPGHASCIPAASLNVVACPQGWHDSNSCHCGPGYKRSFHNGVNQRFESCEPETKTLKLIEQLNCSSTERVWPYIDANGTCVCQAGFSWDSKKRECLLEQKSKRIIENLGCDEVAITDMGNLVCLCDEKKHQKQDDQYHFCVEDYWPEIQHCKSANGQFNMTTKTCECLENEMKYQQDNSTGWQCMNKCAALNIINGGKHRCSEAFSVCQSDMIRQNTRDVFIEGIHEIESPHELGDRMSHCDCLQEFSVDKDKKTCSQNGDWPRFQMTVSIVRDSKSAKEIADVWDAMLQQTFDAFNYFFNDIHSFTECKNHADLTIFECKTMLMFNAVRMESLIDQGPPIDIHKLNEFVINLINRRSLLKDDFEPVQLNEPSLNGYAVKVKKGDKKMIELIKFVQKSLQVKEEEYCAGNIPCRDWPKTQCGIGSRANAMVECRCRDPKYVVSKEEPSRITVVAGRSAVFESCKLRELYR